VAVATLTVVNLLDRLLAAPPLLAVAGFLLLAGVVVTIPLRWPGSFGRWIRCRCIRGGVGGPSTDTNGQPRWISPSCTATAATAPNTNLSY
jgi:hypothetical protein